MQYELLNVFIWDKNSYHSFQLSVYTGNLFATSKRNEHILVHKNCSYEIVLILSGPAPDLQLKLNISSFLALPHVLECLICTSNSVSIVLLLWMMEGGGGWDRWGVVDLHQGVGGGTGGGYYLIVFWFFFCALLFFGLSCPVSFLSE